MKTTTITMMIALLLASSSAYAASAQKIMDKGCNAVKNGTDHEGCQLREAQYLSANKIPCDPVQAQIYNTQMVSSVCEPATGSPRDISFSQCVQGSGVINIKGQTISANDSNRSIMENISGSKEDIKNITQSEKQALDELLEFESQDLSVASLTEAPQYDSQCHVINNAQASNESFGSKVENVVVQIYNLADPEKAALLGSGNLR
jgi:hypothetical protein